MALRMIAGKGSTAVVVSSFVVSKIVVADWIS